MFPSGVNSQRIIPYSESRSRFGSKAIARLRLVWAGYQKRVFLLSNLPIEMPVDHLIEFNDLMPERLEMELIKTGDLPLTPLGLEKIRPDLEMSKEAIKSLFRRSKADEPKSLMLMLPDLLQTATQIATFNGGKILSVISGWIISTGLSLKFRGSNTVKGSGSYKYL